MESLINRYRNVTVLLLVIFAQLVLLAYQVKSNQDVRLIRVWAVTAVTPVAKVLESVRSATVRVLDNYVLLHNSVEENRRLQADLGRLKIENQYLRAELDTADRVRALAAFQERTPSQMVAARVIGTGTGTHSKAVFVDRGSSAGVMKGMAVVTPDGIVGKVVAAYPTASQVLLVTDATFAAGVISQKNRVHGTVKGLGRSGAVLVDYIQNEEKVEVGELFYTSGDDRVFPKGLPVGVATVVKAGPQLKQVYLSPSGLQGGLEEVLIVLEGIHQPIPEYAQASKDVKLLDPPPPEAGAVSLAAPPADAAVGTDADRLRQQYRQIGEAQGHTFGAGLPGSRPPNFNLKPEAKPAPGAAGAVAAQAGAASSAGAPPAAGSPATAQPKPAAGTPGAAQRPAPGAAGLAAQPRAAGAGNGPPQRRAGAPGSGVAAESKPAAGAAAAQPRPAAAANGTAAPPRAAAAAGASARPDGVARPKPPAGAASVLPKTNAGAPDNISAAPKPARSPSAQ